MYRQVPFSKWKVTTAGMNILRVELGANVCILVWFQGTLWSCNVPFKSLEDRFRISMVLLWCFALFSHNFKWKFKDAFHWLLPLTNTLMFGMDRYLLSRPFQLWGQFQLKLIKIEYIYILVFITIYRNCNSLILLCEGIFFSWMGLTSLYC